MGKFEKYVHNLKPLSKEEEKKQTEKLEREILEREILERKVRDELEKLKKFQYDSAIQEYNLKRQELWNLDSKVYWILSINFVLFGLFAKFSDFPREFYGKLFFILGYLLIGVSCFSLINILNPIRFKVLGLEFYNKNSLIKEMDISLIELKNSYNQLRKCNELKCIKIRNAIILTLFSLIIFALINIGGYFMW